MSRTNERTLAPGPVANPQTFVGAVLLFSAIWVILCQLNYIQNHAQILSLDTTHRASAVDRHSKIMDSDHMVRPYTISSDIEGEEERDSQRRLGVQGITCLVVSS